MNAVHSTKRTIGVNHTFSLSTVQTLYTALLNNMVNELITVFTIENKRTLKQLQFDNSADTILARTTLLNG